MFEFPWNRQKQREGFTLVEILLSVAVISSLFIFISSKVNVADVLAELLSTGEEVGVQVYGKAIGSYRWNSGGDLPPNSNITEALKFICKQTVSQADCAADEGVSLNIPDYITKYPIHQDYEASAERMTGYKIQYPYGPGGRVRITNSDETAEFVY